MNCKIVGCPKSAWMRGWCTTHYGRWLRHGDPLAVVRQVTRGSIADRFWAKVRRGSDCWEWQARKTKAGYGQFALPRGGARWKTELAHRVAWELTHGEIPVLCVLHTCDNPSCVRPDHLFLGTKVENNLDRDKKGRTAKGVSHWRHLRPERGARGERAGLAKLTDQAVREIRRRYAAGGVSQQALANEFGVNQTKISDVVNHRTWKHVK